MLEVRKTLRHGSVASTSARSIVDVRIVVGRTKTGLREVSSVATTVDLDDVLKCVHRH
jgi:hypothetical protein